MNQGIAHVKLGELETALARFAYARSLLLPALWEDHPIVQQLDDYIARVQAELDK